MRATRNRVYGQPYQGFESLLLRQNKKAPHGAFFILMKYVDLNPGKGFEPRQKGGRVDAGCALRNFARSAQANPFFSAINSPAEWRVLQTCEGDMFSKSNSIKIPLDGILYHTDCARF